MALTYDDLKDDWQVMDGIVEITFTPKNRSGASAVEEVKALQRAVSLRDLSIVTGVGLDDRNTVWHLWDSTITGDHKPQPGDEITDEDDQVWKIASAEQHTLKTRWRCVCTAI